MTFSWNESTLPLGELGVKQVAFDGSYFYFTLFHQKIIKKVTTHFVPFGNFHTKRVYDCLCYDSKRQCFWATVSHSATRLFQLNCNMEEVSCVSLKESLQGRITGLSYSCCQDALLLAYPWGVFSFSLLEPRLTLLQSSTSTLTGISSICPAYALVQRKKREQILQFYFENGDLVKEISLPSSYSLVNILFHPCYCGKETLVLFVRQKGCYLNVFYEPITSYDLGFEPCICNYKLCQGSCHCTSCCDPVGDVMESIALIEASLSHILNAQGEQLQKIVAESSCVEELLGANQQINETITKVTHLEILLQDKLESLSKICDIQKIVPYCGEKGGDILEIVADTTEEPN